MHVTNYKTWVVNGRGLLHVGAICDVIVGRGLHGAITQFQLLCEDLQWKVDVNRIKLFSTFFFTTFMVHYRLYQLVLSPYPREARHLNTACLHLPLYSPPCSFPSLTLGKDPDVWNYENTIDQLNKMASETRQRREAERTIVEKEDDRKMKVARSSCEDHLGPTLDEKVSVKSRDVTCKPFCAVPPGARLQGG